MRCEAAPPSLDGGRVVVKKQEWAALNAAPGGKLCLS